MVVSQQYSPRYDYRELHFLTSRKGRVFLYTEGGLKVPSEIHQHSNTASKLTCPGFTGSFFKACFIKV